MRSSIAFPKEFLFIDSYSYSLSSIGPNRWYFEIGQGSELSESTSRYRPAYFGSPLLWDCKKYNPLGVMENGKLTNLNLENL
jgi:hypothetical protein